MVFKVEITANEVAWYGAIVATVSMAVSLLNHLRDKATIKLKVSKVFFAYRSGLDKSLKLMAKAVNTGRRPITITSVGFSLSNKRDIVITNDNIIPNLPAKLAEGEQLQFWVEENKLLSLLKKSKTELNCAWCQDAAGKLYKKKYRIKPE
ncbi:MAG: hypothetical protein JW991_01530 [Candidatus Pacebacteria bacterium]|nr:hypothetical protein [Candidatus Paceibacterota bacterium]